MMLHAAIGFVGLTLRSLTGGKRAWAAAFLVLLPPFFAGLAALFGKHVEPINLFHGFIFEFSLWFVIYLLSLIYGIALTMGEIEDGTAGYLYLSAVPKWLIVLIQMGVTTLTLTGMLFVNLALTGLARREFDELLPVFTKALAEAEMPTHPKPKKRQRAPGGGRPIAPIAAATSRPRPYPSVRPCPSAPCAERKN